jgi:hypothetical protein
MLVDLAVLELEPLRDAFIARELESRRLSKKCEDEWISNIAEQVERHEHAVRRRCACSNYSNTKICLFVKRLL